MSLSRPEGAAGICRGLKELQAQRPTDSCKEKGIVSIGSRSARQVPRTPDKLPKRPTRLHAVRTQRRRSRRILIAPGRFAQTPFIGCLHARYELANIPFHKSSKALHLCAQCAVTSFR